VLTWFGSGGRAVARCPAALPGWLPAVLAGLLAVTTVISLSFRAGATRDNHPPAWLGERVPHTTPGHQGVLAAGVVLAVALLIASWVRLQRRVGEGWRRTPLRIAVAAGVLWVVPFVVSPPLLSQDVYSYAAIGQLVERGHDPYAVGPAALGGGPFLAAVDPLWRNTPTPYGPVILALTHGTAELASGSLLNAVLLLRLVALGATAVAVALAVWASKPSARGEVLLLTAVNPLVLLHLVSGAHLDALIGAAAVGVVLLTLRARWSAAMVLASVAVMAKAPALVLVGFVLLYAARQAPAGRRLRSIGGLLAVGGVTVGLVSLLVPNPFGWIAALVVPGRTRNLAAPSTWLAQAVSGLSNLVTGGLHQATALTIGRALAMAIGSVLVLLLLWRGTGQPDRARTMRCVGGALLVVAVSGPVIYGWYLGWGLFAAAVGCRARHRDALVVLSALSCAIGLPAMQKVPLTGQIAVWVAVVAVGWWARPAAPRNRRVFVPRETRAA
jgi:hypothetical protein